MIVFFLGILHSGLWGTQIKGGAQPITRDQLIFDLCSKLPGDLATESTSEKKNLLANDGEREDDGGGEDEEEQGGGTTSEVWRAASCSAERGSCQIQKYFVYLSGVYYIWLL